MNDVLLNVHGAKSNTAGHSNSPVLTVYALVNLGYIDKMNFLSYNYIEINIKGGLYMDTIKFKKGNTLVIAHRGLSGIETENTNAAFVAAGNRSYYGVETDTHITSDGRFVINHDFDLRRVSGENVPVEEVSLALLQQVVLFDSDGSKDRMDLRPGTLENYISICKKYDKHCVLELKSDFTGEALRRMVDIIRGYNYLDSTTFISFNYKNLTGIREIIPEQSVQFLFSECTKEIVDRLIADRIDADVYFKALSKEVVEQLHDAGRKVNCWTVDQREDAEQLVEWGVDYITSNILE